MKELGIAGKLRRISPLAAFKMLTFGGAAGPLTATSSTMPSPLRSVVATRVPQPVFAEYWAVVTHQFYEVALVGSSGNFPVAM